MKAKCTKGFSIERCDDNGFTIENEYSTIEENSCWNIENDKYRFIGGEIRLTNSELEWLEISEETFKEHFEIIKREHELKILPEYFEAIKNGTKTFEIRKNDRGFAIGDILTLKEYSGEKYTGREINKVIIYILTGRQYGLEKEYVVLGIK